MSDLPLAILTIIVIVAVFAATQPSAPVSRRRPPAPKRPRAEAPTRMRPAKAAQSRLDDTHRNRWTRTDLALAIGRDHVAAELDLLAWPTPEV
ncbi:MAG: hypothetical protein ACR2OO_04005 [Thermomicrobiales bacterium]